MSTVLALIDVLDGDHVRQSFAVPAGADGSTRLRIGRALHCEICLDDAQLAAEHAQLHIGPEPEGLLTLLPSLNGASVGRQRYASGTQLRWQSEGVLQLGHTRLRLRHAAAPLKPERAQLHAPRWLGLALLALAALLLDSLDQWLSLDPGARWMAYVGPLAGNAVALAAWAGLWAALTQLFQRRFPFLLHLRRALVVLVLVLVAGLLLPMLSFALSAPGLMWLDAQLDSLAFVALVYWHAREVWPHARVFMAVTLIGGTLLTQAMSWSRQNQQQHWSRPPYVSSLQPPALRLAPLRPVDELLKDAAALQPELAEKARRDPAGELLDDGDSEE